MKTKHLITVAAVSAGLAFGVAAQGHEKEKEETLSSTDVPAAVQKAAETQAKGEKIVRWEKEGANYEAVIDKSGKQWGVKIDTNGKVLSKHEESKEHKEKGEKYYSKRGGSSSPSSMLLWRRSRISFGIARGADDPPSPLQLKR